MNINTKQLLRFFELIALKGEIENREALISIEQNTIKTIIGHTSKTLALYAELKGEFEDVGNIGIDNIQFLISFLKSFKTEEVGLSINKNKLILQSEEDKLKISGLLREPEYIINALEIEKINTLIEKSEGNEFILEKTNIKDILKYINALGSEKIILKGENKEVKVTLEHNENEILASFSIEQEIKPFSVKVMRQITSVLNIINSNVKISINNESPISFKIDEGNILITYVVAPIK